MQQPMRTIFNVDMGHQVNSTGRAYKENIYVTWYRTQNLTSFYKIGVVLFVHYSCSILTCPNQPFVLTRIYQLMFPMYNGINVVK